jgi:hypothetical protein
VLAGLASAYVAGTPWIGSIAQDGYQAVSGMDFMSGEKLSAGQRAWSVAAVGLELVPGFAGAIADGVGGVIGAGMRGARATKAVMVKAGSQGLSIAGETARRGLMHAQAAGVAAKVGAGRFASGFAEAYTASRHAQTARLMSDPLLGLGTEMGHVAGGMAGGVKKLFRQTDEAAAAAARAPLPGSPEFIGPMDFVGPRMPLAPENAAPRRPGGYRTGDFDSHGRLSPGVNRAPGHTNTRADGFVQSHHGIQREWAKRKVTGYDEAAAPANLLRSSSGEVHAKISAAQRARRRQPGGWDTDIRTEFNLSYREMIDAGLSPKDAQRLTRQNYKYFDSLGAFD